MQYTMTDDYGKDDIDISHITIDYCPGCQQPYDVVVGPMCSCIEDARDVQWEMDRIRRELEDE